MGVLAEYLKTEAEHLRAEAKDWKEAVDEWRKALEGLYNQMSEWLHDADGGLDLLWASDRTVKSITEPRLGSYDANVLAIGLGRGSREVLVAPRARYVAASIKPPGREMRRADGMVEIKDGAVAVYYLFRWASPSGDEWFLRSVSQWNADAEYGRVEPLDRDRFEAAVLSILR